MGIPLAHRSREVFWTIQTNDSVVIFYKGDLRVGTILIHLDNRLIWTTFTTKTRVQFDFKISQRQLPYLPIQKLPLP